MAETIPRPGDVRVHVKVARSTEGVHIQVLSVDRVEVEFVLTTMSEVESFCACIRRAAATVWKEPDVVQ